MRLVALTSMCFPAPTLYRNNSYRRLTNSTSSPTHSVGSTIIIGFYRSPFWKMIVSACWHGDIWDSECVGFIVKWSICRQSRGLKVGGVVSTEMTLTLKKVH
jgi:hypothetical protein